MRRFLIFFLSLVLLFSVVSSTLAEDKSTPAGIIPKIPKTADDPILENGGVYPMWGPVCQRYTYHTTYRDKEGRPPEYVRLYFNGSWINVSKENPNDIDYKKGVKYVYKFVPNKLGSNFFFFEASNGKGKTREGIIDSPGNGPVLFEGDFKDNEIVLIDGKSGQKLWSFPTGSAWVSGVALSDDGKYLATLTAKSIYLFDTSSSKPLWVFSTGFNMDTAGDVKGGIDISGDGSKIFASIGNQTYLFDKKSKEPLWIGSTGNNGAYSAAISKNGKYMAVGTAGEENNQNSNLIILWNESNTKPLWQYHASGNFHEVSLSDDGKFIAGSTGCPDRRAYIFSRDSNQPILRSEMLTRDSPVDEAQIAGDGTWAAFGLESDRGGLAIFKNGNQEPFWRFETADHKSIRALSVASGNRLIAAGTFGGDVYVFDKDLNQPKASWKINASVGAVGISSDGQVLAVGGADSKVHLYSPKDKNYHKEIDFGEYVGEIEVSGNGKYVAAGTSGSTYFFETFSPNEGKVFPCTTVIEPSPMGTIEQGESGSRETESFPCKNGECEGKPAEKPIIKNTGVFLPGMIFGFGFLGFSFLLGFFTAVRRLKMFEKQKNILAQFNISKLSPLKLTGKKITTILAIPTLLFLVLTIVAVLVNKKTMNMDYDAGVNQGEAETKCGNTICEPVAGETKENCPKDCSEGN